MYIFIYTHNIHAYTLISSRPNALMQCALPGKKQNCAYTLNKDNIPNLKNKLKTFI